MDKRQIKKILVSGGATLNSDGVAVSFRDGYQVSKKDCYKIAVEKVNQIARAVNKLLLTVNRGEFVGVWVDDNKVYIDISVRVRKQEKAERIGRSLHQLAIYDWSACDCITL